MLVMKHSKWRLAVMVSWETLHAFYLSQFSMKNKKKGSQRYVFQYWNMSCHDDILTHIFYIYRKEKVRSGENSIQISRSCTSHLWKVSFTFHFILYKLFLSGESYTCSRADRSDIPDIDKKKYLVPSDLTVGQFHYVIRKRIKLAPEKALFLFCSNSIPPNAALMSTVYEEQKDEVRWNSIIL
jgi:hypothetical protein